MAIPLLKDVPLAPPADLGPYRRKDYEALPDEPRCELIYGRFYVSPSPSVLHQLVLALVFEKLTQAARTVGAWTFFAPLDVYLFDHSVAQPDVMYISAARRGIIEKRIEGAPDLVVEVLSPGTARRDRGEKLRLYAEAGVREYWIFDPPERQIEFLRNDSGQFVVALPEGGVYRSPALSEISLDVTQFWREIDERVAALDADP
ncbi:MAG TPA: Uma2 family endonuclease [Thermoanaerobaculia bacterium]|jgi:Uma2 family endonuclease|nr:Uma2 family endonuclease [Thermoanaerobaculia bacterium]